MFPLIPGSQSFVVRDRLFSGRGRLLIIRCSRGRFLTRRLQQLPGPKPTLDILLPFPVKSGFVSVNL
jgi:hypothetical protein